MYVDRESLLSKSQSELLIRPALYLNGTTPVPHSHLLSKLLKKATLRTTTTNDEGVCSSQLVSDFKLSADPNAPDTVHRFSVSDSLRRIEFVLTLELRLNSTGGSQTVSATTSYQLNGIEDSDRINELHLRYGTDGRCGVALVWRCSLFVYVSWCRFRLSCFVG